jgi:NADH-quinone oxidoreductase subunit M
MNLDELFKLPWLELAIGLSLLGGPVAGGLLRTPGRAARACVLLNGLVFGCTFLAWLGFYLYGTSGADPDYSLQSLLFGRQFLRIDELSAPMVPLIALLHLLITVATTRTKMPRYAFGWSMVSEASRLAAFCFTDPWAIIAMLAMGCVPPYVDLVKRGRPTRVYVLHMGLFVVLMVLGWAILELGGDRRATAAWASLPLLAAVLLHNGAVPVHCWMTDLFEHASFGTALLFVTPIMGVYAAVRLVLPIAPEWVLQSLAWISLITAVYAAGMAVVQREARRFFAYLFLSHSSLVLVGLELVTDHSLTGALCLWFSVALSLGGFGLTLRALEARFGRLALTDFHGLYEHTPTLAVCFLLTGLASVGFPFTLGFVSQDLLIEGVIEVYWFVGCAVAVTAALNGIAVLRAYLLLFTGARHASTVSLNIGPRERFAVLMLAVLILGGGLFPQPGVKSRHEAAAAVIRERRAFQGGESNVAGRQPGFVSATAAGEVESEDD